MNGILCSKVLFLLCIWFLPNVFINNCYGGTIVKLEDHCELNGYSVVCVNFNFPSDDVEIVAENKLDANILSIQAHSMYTFPRNLFKVLNITSTLTCSGCGITQLYKWNFENAEHIGDILFNANDFHSIPNGALSHLESLAVLNLNYGQLAELNIESFQGLTNLRKLHMAHNKLTAILDGALDPLVSLKLLDLSHNNIGMISDNTFKGTLNLEKLSISHNNLQSFGREAITQLSNLVTLNLAVNSFEELYVSSVGYLRATSGRIKSVHILKSADLVFLDDNNIEEISIANMSAIGALILQKNSLRSASLTDWKNAPNLFALDISQNPITHIDDDMFDKMPHLLLLNISSTNMEFIEPELFSKLTHIEQLLFDNNTLTPENQKDLERKRDEMYDIAGHGRNLMFAFYRPEYDFY